MMPGISVVQADVHDAKQLQALVHGHDIVINLIAILHGDEEAFTRVHVNFPASLARACHAEHVTRLIHISALGADVHAPSMYQRSKARGELALLSAAQKEPLGLTIIRPSVIFGKDDQFINLFARLQKIFPVMPLAGAHTRFQPVWVHDVAQAVVHCVNTSSTEGQIFEACGPDVLTLAELVQLAGRWVGKPRPVISLPYAIGWLQALLMEWAPGPTLMSRDNLDSMKVHNIASGRMLGLRALGISEPKSIKRLFVAQAATK
jgi:NADH dehydrogenase